MDRTELTNFADINSLTALRRRKRKIKKQVKIHQDIIMEDISNFAEPFKLLLDPDNSDFKDSIIVETEYHYQPKAVYHILKGIKTVKRLSKIFMIGKSIFYDYKK